MPNKYFIPGLFLIFAAFDAFPQRVYELQYAWSTPIALGSFRQSSLGAHEKASFGGMLSLQIQKSLKAQPNTLIGMEFDLGISSIFVDGVNQKTYYLDDGTQARINTEAATTLKALSFTWQRYFFEDKKIQPYILGRAGVGYLKSQIAIFDADDTDNCEPIDKRVLSRSFTPIITGGVGVAFDLSLFKDVASNVIIFTLSGSVSHGAKVRYNTTADLTSLLSNQHVVNGKFINASTGDIHEHVIGYSNTAWLEMAEVKAGITVRLDFRD